MFRCACLIVTFNRLESLKKCLNCVENQTLPFDAIFVVNNGSTDETPRFLTTQTQVTTITQHNLGAAGGWNNGLKAIYSANFDLAYIIDDDCYLENNAHEEIFNCWMGLEDRERWVISSYSSETESKIPGPLLDLDDKAKHPPTRIYANPSEIPTNKLHNNLYVGWAHFMLGVLLPKTLAFSVGLPDSKYYIRGEDYEYLLRCIRNARAGCCLTSCLLHGIPPVKDDSKSLVLGAEKNYFQIRNHMYINRLYFPSWKNTLLSRVVKCCFEVFVDLVKTGTINRRLIDAYVQGTSGKFVNPPDSVT